MTENTVEMVKNTGLDLSELIANTTWFENELGRTLSAMIDRAGPFPKKDC